jgi:predicted transcriptional regulator
MRVLWEHGASTVAAVSANVTDEPVIAFNTVQSTLRALEAKGYVRHTESKRIFVYEAAVGPEWAAEKAVDHIVSRFFDGMAGNLALSLVRDGRLDRETRKQIADLLRDDETP